MVTGACSFWYWSSILSRRFCSMRLPLTVDRGNRMFIVQVLLLAFSEKNGKIIVRLHACFDPLPVDEEDREHLVFLDGLVQEFLLDVRSCRRSFRRGRRLRGCAPGLKRGRNGNQRVWGGEVREFLFQEGNDPAVLFHVDIITADVTNDAFVFGFVHLSDAESGPALECLRQEQRFD